MSSKEWKDKYAALIKLVQELNDNCPFDFSIQCDNCTIRNECNRAYDIEKFLLNI